ncbi:MAG: penicillin-binding protein 2 [Candidatus Liptonbacteria bacterium]|nr:penicillin-binding protein 2 [Candidatus Liptonbacteria bacterium]
MGIRFSLIFIIFTLVYAVLLANFYHLQLNRGDYFMVRAEAHRRLAFDLEPERGNIFFTDKNKASVPVAVKKYYPLIFAVPKNIVNINETASILAKVLNIEEKKILSRISNKKDPYEIILRKASLEQAQEIQKLNLKGIGISQEPYRFYPNERLASHLLGFVSENSGRYGIESFYNHILKGEPGVILGEKIVPPKKGEDIYLTIDRNIQAAAEKILGDAVAKHKAESGMIIVMNPKNGEILAMSFLPNFDPNNFGELEVKNFLNPAVQSVYEPGSVLKPITMAIGIETGKITPYTEFVDKGYVTLNNRTIRNWDFRAYGKTDMSKIIEKSINTGIVFVAQQIGKSVFYDYLKNFGLNKKTGIDLPGEVTGNLRTLRDGRDINLATASFGQGIAVTPIRLLTAINVIANNGLMVKPHLLAGNQECLGRVISEETSRQVTEMMIAKVDEIRSAQISGYSVAGKTGTAQIPDFQKGGYTDELIHTFVGFAPAYNPRFIALIRMDKGKGPIFASQTIMPAFRELAQFILNYYEVSPDRL